MSPKNKCHGWVGECDVFGCTFVLCSLQHFRSFDLLSAHSHSLDEKQCGPRSAGFMRSQLIWINTVFQKGFKISKKVTCWVHLLG